MAPNKRVVREAAKKSFFSGQFTKRGEGGVRGCPFRKKELFFNFFLFFFVAVLLTTKPRG